MAALTADEMTGFVRFVNKATGWLYVALGALLIAVKRPRNWSSSTSGRRGCSGR